MSAVGQVANGLEPWSENPWYWSRDGQPVMLLGGSDDDNLFQWPDEKLTTQLDRIVAAGGNVVRNTMSDRRDKGFEVYPFLRLPSGKYDLDQWNPEYWRRFEFFLKQTAARQIVVQIEIWDRFDYTDARAHDAKRWEQHPYNPGQNINYTYEESGFAKRYPDHPGQNKQPFFFTTPQQRNNAVVLKYQRAFVNRLLDISLQHDHVLYCMDNETSAQPAWGEYWAKLVQARAKQAGKQVMTTEMWDDWDLHAKRHRQTFDHPELYGFVDVSQNNQNSGQRHWDNFLYVRKYLSTKPRPMNTTKTYGADGNKFKHTDQDAIERFWRHLLAGAASIRFHRPDSGLGINDRAVRCIRTARMAEQLIPFWLLEGENQWLAGRQENEAYLASDAAGQRWMLYFPAGKHDRRVQLNLPGDGDVYNLTWFDIDAGKIAAQRQVSISAAETVQAETSGNCVLVAIRQTQ